MSEIHPEWQRVHTTTSGLVLVPIVHFFFFCALKILVNVRLSPEEWGRLLSLSLSSCVWLEFTALPRQSFKWVLVLTIIRKKNWREKMSVGRLFMARSGCVSHRGWILYPNKSSSKHFLSIRCISDSNLGAGGPKVSKKDAVCTHRDYPVRWERNGQFSSIGHSGRV